MASRTRSLLKSSKAQFFVLSAFIIVSILLLVSTWLEPLSIPDASTAVLAEEHFVMNNIKEKAEQTVKLSKDCEDLRYNLEEYEIFIQKYLTITKNIKVNFDFDTVSPCDNDVLETHFDILLESPNAFVTADFTSKKDLTTVTSTTTTSTTTTTTIPTKRVFVSSFGSHGNLGGVDVANTKCNDLAEDAGLGGIWKAWLSTELGGGRHAIQGIPDVKYVRMDGVVIANNKADLIDGSIQNPINRDENNEEAISDVWTGTSTDGTPAKSDCSGWTSSSSSISGVRGNSGLTNEGWTFIEPVGLTCNNNEKRIYCFEIS